jgi:hypothetical protein
VVVVVVVVVVVADPFPVFGASPSCLNQHVSPREQYPALKNLQETWEAPGGAHRRARVDRWGAAGAVLRAGVGSGSGACVEACVGACTGIGCGLVVCPETWEGAPGKNSVASGEGRWRRGERGADGIVTALSELFVLFGFRRR